MQRRSNGLVKTTTRDTQIRTAVAEMNELLHEKNRVRDRIRGLSARVSKELGYTSGDFTMGVRLAKMAEKKETRTLNTVREMLLALGNSIPEVAPPHIVPVIGKVHVSVNVKSNARCAALHGLMTAHGGIKAAYAKKILGFEAGTYLTEMKRAGVVRHDVETATWRLAEIL